MGIFEPFRALGCITTQVPVSVQLLGTETFVTVSIGKAFQIYNFRNCPKKIRRALASNLDYTFAAYAHNIAVFKRAHLYAFSIQAFAISSDQIDLNHENKNIG
ncbi:UNVERIFIED_CONTAM: hypothetical protein Scaly_0834900 [Sesamum calycinum]|uniref:Uncharacterized protein n=1 Tax=Sesamum calycinum TaxID=2727403 RepID=A0AAW2RB66_9LAMI